jgi:hypothetical protein
VLKKIYREVDNMEDNNKPKDNEIKKSLTRLCKKIKEKAETTPMFIGKDALDVTLDVVPNVVSGKVSGKVSGVSFRDIITAITDMAKLSYDFKLNKAWNCLSRDTDVEKSINELYDYVSDTERAFFYIK